MNELFEEVRMLLLDNSEKLASACAKPGRDAFYSQIANNTKVVQRMGEARDGVAFQEGVKVLKANEALWESINYPHPIRDRNAQMLWRIGQPRGADEEDNDFDGDRDTRLDSNDRRH